ncbi:hypothetical protein [Bacillus manliponensis]|uniref:hypothetical protein n=1 Tax=Bacillus manliponensis TaxID=574376 RepID=UPI003518AC30
MRIFEQITYSYGRRYYAHLFQTFITGAPFLLVSVINGDGVLKAAHMNYQLQKGDHFILPYNLGVFHIRGKVTLIVSHP